MRRVRLGRRARHDVRVRAPSSPPGRRGSGGTRCSAPGRLGAVQPAPEQQKVHGPKRTAHTEGERLTVWERTASGGGTDRERSSPAFNFFNLHLS